ncbi:MAG: hypothetical protein A3I26_01330 [Candidatus Yanofskybacteria bacterium RIFCSPLOWO2_02_FULL_43_10]|uniref:Thymidylate kinase-like domain-containing protein n=1 Tax=Candidatus Yanofskybacteria bacterium RIFCSPLOWO2_12_FULL_43_11b TaxID=1802710 RepID=A0A1F8HAB3_9BACT|nr:MAG: hypothetical protein A2742_03985 [Candidatus Yanofskybacteria bacterium RIFCSPHIGHO2_01_FULL_43_32]OGN10569.1 MAG: hypothetical protein A3C69_02365 [Candidatus Yanofskybacteria bacterium RIFCSPHIGHO2_02_FULL_43_12]OGN17770.1 MAG: hypothetical protein A3E34_01325 [Candidatus Yanofskybacteria bacterium RIFCSPHIGHO2_12_FULL_43_11]OGN24514.1 MAG: hypothetical protein A2923_00965 [Candidatus Yanofskybacteria bacterium RIFCSPLOWO2_01_FULL_43_46]OGN28412.1 MAG: hypothetical protein A3I26_01330
MIISIIGVNGAGKSTQCRLLMRHLINTGASAVIVKPVDKKTRNRFAKLIKKNSLISTNFLFFSFYRNQAEKLIELQKQGKIAITDRYIESFLLFQQMYGLIKSGHTCLYQEVEKMIFTDARPDIIIYLQVSMAKANKRIALRNRDDENYENIVTYRASVRLYKKLASTKNGVIIDGHASELVVHNQILAALNL